MGAAAVFAQLTPRVERAPFLRPVAAAVVAVVVRVEIQEVAAVGVVTLDVGEVEQHTVMIDAVLPDLFVALVKVALHAGAVKVPRHVDEGDAGIVRLEAAHQVEIELDVLRGGVGLTAP